jgi:hypothetical protein
MTLFHLINIPYGGKDHFIKKDSTSIFSYLFSLDPLCIRRNIQIVRRVYGTLQREDFDPLRFSKMQGDYPEGGKMSGAGKTWSKWVDVIHNSHD